MKIKSLLCKVLTPVVVIGSLLIPAQTGFADVSMGVINENFTYKIKSAKNGKCVDLDCNNPNNGSKIQGWDWLGGKNQKWKFTNLGGSLYKITSLWNGKCIDLNLDDPNNGSQIQGWDWQETHPEQKWYVTYLGNGRYKFTSAWNGKCMDMDNSDNNNGTKIQGWSWLGGTNQQWILEDVDPGIELGASYKITSLWNGKSIDLDSTNINNGSKLRAWDWNNTVNQKWKFYSVGSGNYRIVSAWNGKCIDLDLNNPNNGSQLQAWNYLGGNNQRWKVEYIGGRGAYKITSVYNGKCIDLDSNNTNNGSKIQAWDWLNRYNQMWYLTQQ